ncbi:MAG: hypothetical protein AAB893_02670, partial [Patescibacteria group bacterium]
MSQEVPADLHRQLNLLKEGPVESYPTVRDSDSIPDSLEVFRDRVAQAVPLQRCDWKVLMEWALRNKSDSVPDEQFFGKVLADRVSGILAEQSCQAVAEREEYPDANNFVVITLPNSGRSTVMDVLDEDLKRNLLVVSADRRLNYFGDPELCKILQERFRGECKDNSWCGTRDNKVAPFIRGYFRGPVNPKTYEFLLDTERSAGDISENDKLVDDSGNICGDTRGKIGQFRFEESGGGPCPVKGELVDYKGFKLAVVDPRYDGEMPKVGEMWVCEIAGDTRVGMHRVGTAFLYPQELIEEKWHLTAKGQPVLGVSRLEPICYLGMRHVYGKRECPEHIDNAAAESNGVYERLIRECGLRMNTNLEVADYKLAEGKLGKPISIEPAPGMPGFKLIWKDSTALVSSDVLIRAGLPYTYDSESVVFVGMGTETKASMKANIGGFGDTSVVIGAVSTTGEVRYEDIGKVGEPAYISDICPADVRQKVIELFKRCDGLSPDYYIHR